MKLTARELPRSYWRKVAAKNGILRNTLNYRLSVGWDIEQASTTPTAAHTEKQRGGVKQLCRDAGLHEESVYQYRRYRNGEADDVPAEEIIERIRAHHARLNISALSRESGIPRATLSRRLRAGWPVDRATAVPPMRPEQSGRLAKRPDEHPWSHLALE